MRLTRAHSLVWLGLASNRHIVFGLLVTIGLVHGSPIDLVRLDEHLLRERITQDVHEYIRGLPSDALPQIVDEIDFDDITKVRNDQLFSFACIKIRQMEAEGVVYEKDGPIEKLIRFVKAKLARGDVTFGPVAMVSLTGIEHPLIIALAKDLLDCDHELTRDNAARLLKEYERKLNTRNALQGFAEDRVGARFEEALSKCDVGANGELVATAENKKIIREHVCDSWSELLPGGDVPSLDPRSQLLVVVAAVEALPRDEYLEFVIATLTSFSEGRLSESTGRALVFPCTSSKEGFLAVNYGNQDLAKALRAALPRFGSDASAEGYIRKILSGVAKVEYEEMMRAQGLTPQLPITSATKEHRVGQGDQPIELSRSPARAGSRVLGSDIEGATRRADRIPRWAWVGSVALLGLALLALMRRWIRRGVW